MPYLIRYIMQFNSPKNPGVGIDNPSFTDEEIEVP